MISFSQNKTPCNETCSSSTTSNPALQVKAPKLPTKTEFTLDQEKSNHSNEKEKT